MCPIIRDHGRLNCNINLNINQHIYLSLTDYCLRGMGYNLGPRETLSGRALDQMPQQMCQTKKQMYLTLFKFLCI